MHGDNENVSDRLLVLLQTGNPLEAHLMKTKLESEDIECFIQDENMGLFTNAIGGVKLLVREKDAEHAIAILSSPEQE
jgi:hypothetical protein